MTIRQVLSEIAAKRILILDGAMGTMIQRFGLTEGDFRGDMFAAHHQPLKGCNDLLCLTKPAVIAAIHQAYLRAGADIIETCSFNANAPSLFDYGLSDKAYEISRAAARLARESADRYSTQKKPRFVAGVMGPTGKTASLSPDVNDPGARGIGWDELVAAYRDNARGLLDGGVDILMVETIFDTLNAKAAIFAIDDLLEERNLDVPLMISGTIADAAGRTLSGQTVDAFCTSLLHGRPWSIGLNCSLGAEKMLPHVKALATAAPCLISAHPNAGLPNQFGQYDESPEAMAEFLRPFLTQGLLNVVGGCCGTTPAHIAAIVKLASQYAPRVPVPGKSETMLSGLECLTVSREIGFVDVGERTNVAGSKKFLRLVKENKFDEALAIARQMVDSGAGIIDVCMDDALLDAKKAMVTFLNLALADPEIARVPVMVDSSRWDVIEAGLKCLQGKGIVNSISLKEGEAEFRRRLALTRRYGAAVVVMLFDEQGQADNYDRKIGVAGRCWKLLQAEGFPAEDVIFDPNVLSVATGISEHDRYGLDFIRACAWIRDNCPGAHISGGLSNLSFSFRGNDTVREAMHAVFLKHAVANGLSMAIVNPASLENYDDLQPELRELAEDVILARSPDAAERLLTKALEIKETADAAKATGLEGITSAKSVAKDEWRSLPVEDRIIYGLIKGIDQYIVADVLELRPRFARSLGLIEGPLMKGMNEVGDRFGAGRMFLPQVIRSARVMKSAVNVLEPYIQAEKALDHESKDRNKGSSPVNRSAKILMATVKGDVHDIGKNIVGVVLGCNGFEVIDLGVMVPAEIIIETAIRENVDIIGLSGLITPSLDEMVHVARELERRHMTIPLIIGGATTSEVHTALRIAPEYSAPVVYTRDAGRSAGVVRALLSPAERPKFLEKLETDYRAAAEQHERTSAVREYISLEAARANAFHSEWPEANIREPAHIGLLDTVVQPIEELVDYIDWSYFFYSWDLGHGFESILNDPDKGEAAQKLYGDARQLLDSLIAERRLEAKASLGIFPAASSGDDVVMYDSDDRRTEVGRFSFPRNQNLKKNGGVNPCLADFVAPATGNLRDYVGLFALTAGIGLDAVVAEFTAEGDDYNALLVKTLADRLAEAFAEQLHERVRRELWAYAPDESLTKTSLFAGEYRGIRPAFGYPACPDHTDKRIAFKLLNAEQRCGIHLTDSDMMIPAASVCGLYFAHPASWYFGVGLPQPDQLEDWALRKGITVEEAHRRWSTV